MAKRLEGKVALVTGGSKGIGRETAVQFAEQGAKVVIAARNQEQLDAVIAEIKAAGGEAAAVVGDVRKEEDIKNMVALAVSTFGGLHVAFNNAGVFEGSSFVEMHESQVDRILDTNLKSIVFCLKHQIPAMAQSGVEGSIIMCSSVMSMRAQVTFKTAGVYAASKAGVDMLVRYGAIEAAEHGIRVNAVNPGIVATPLWDGVSEEALKQMCSATQVFERPSRPEEIARMVVFLASDESSMVTGSTHTVDGGWALKA